MKKEVRTVWTSDDGSRELLVKKSNDEWYIPLGTVSTETLEELNAAIDDALGVV